METGEYHRLRAVEETHWWFRGLNEHVVRCLQQALPDGGLRLLDAGCGTGGLLVRLATLGEVEGVDASPLAVQICRARGLRNVRCEDLNTLALPVAQYDAVTCIDVLYHRDISDETAVLSALGRSLRPGGLLLLHLPAYEWLRSRHDRRVHTRRRYRRREVRRLLDEAGLVTEHLSYRLTLYLPAVALVRLLSSLGERRKRDSDVRRVPSLLNSALLLGCRLENRLSLRLPLPFGVSIYAIARRPTDAAHPEAEGPRR